MTFLKFRFMKKKIKKKTTLTITTLKINLKEPLLVVIYTHKIVDEKSANETCPRKITIIRNIYISVEFKNKLISMQTQKVYYNTNIDEILNFLGSVFFLLFLFSILLFFCSYRTSYKIYHCIILQIYVKN